MSTYQKQYVYVSSLNAYLELVNPKPAPDCYKKVDHGNGPAFVSPSYKAIDYDTGYTLEANQSIDDFTTAFSDPLSSSYWYKETKMLIFFAGHFVIFDLLNQNRVVYANVLQNGHTHSGIKKYFPNVKLDKE